MNVVIHSTYLYGVAPGLVNHFTDVREGAFQILIAYLGTHYFNMEHQMDVDLREGLGHGRVVCLIQAVKEG